MPPRRRNRGGRAASTAASTPGTDEEASVKATPSSAAPSLTSSKKSIPYKEPVNDEWTDEQDTSLFKGLVQWKPVGKVPTVYIKWHCSHH